VAQPVPRELVEEVLPLALPDSIRRSVAGPGLEKVVEVASIARDRGRGVGLRLAATATLDSPVRDAVHPLVAE
jgi:hypothetical protein